MSWVFKVENPLVADCPGTLVIGWNMQNVPPAQMTNFAEIFPKAAQNAILSIQQGRFEKAIFGEENGKKYLILFCVDKVIHGSKVEKDDIGFCFSQLVDSYIKKTGESEFYSGFLYKEQDAWKNIKKIILNKKLNWRLCGGK